MKSAAKDAANKRYDRKTYEQIRIDSRREDRLRDLIAVAAGHLGISSGEYIRRAIWARLRADGIDAGALDEMPQRGRRLNAADAGTDRDEDG